MTEMFDREYLKQVVLKVLAVVFGLLFAAYVGYHVWHRLTSFVETQPALPFSVTEKSSGEGYIFREERVIAPMGSGRLVPGVEEGERVSVGSQVAGLYSSSSAEIESRLSEIDRQIALLTAAVGDGNLTNRDVSKLDGEIYDVIADMKKDVASGNYSDAIAQRSALLMKINKRNVASGASSEIPARIDALNTERASLVSQLGQLQARVTAPVAGWYYSETDGYESVFTVTEIEKMTYESYKKLVDETVPASTDGVGKMVTSCKWYFVCEVSPEEAENKEEGETYTLFFVNNQNKQLEMNLEKICKSEDGAVLVYSCDRMPEGFNFLRRQKYEILEKEYSGCRVPKSAVRMVDGQMGVFVLTGEVVHFRKIEIAAEYEGGYIVTMEHKEVETAKEETTAEETAAEETVSEETTAETEKVEEKKEPLWLGLNENIIVSGKGLREGRIITNLS